MEGKLSDRAKVLFKDPAKVRLLMEYILNPSSRKFIEIIIENDKVDIVETKKHSGELQRTENLEEVH